MENTPNISWLFYKDYYSDLSKHYDNPKKLKLKAKNKQIFSQQLVMHATDLLQIQANTANVSFELKTTYPGLIAGTGIAHSIKNEEEIKLGFSFDHTSGLPVIPGSSVKGLLRSIFPARLKIAAEKNAKLAKKAAAMDIYFTKVLLPKVGLTAEEIQNIDIAALEKNIFEGFNPNALTTAEENNSIYGRDVFFDAYPSQSFFQGKKDGDEKGRFLGEGVITPHGKDKLKNPIPLRFLKILPEVAIHFQFKLEAVTINGVEFSSYRKSELFRLILQRFGLGAKTNVGFGKLGVLDNV